MSRGRVATLLGTVAIVGLLIGSAGRTSVGAAELPTFDEAVKSLVHGRHKVKKRAITVTHDFQNSSHLKDFSGLISTYTVGKGSIVDLDGGSKNVFTKGATMGFSTGMPVHLGVPLEQIDVVQFEVTGIQDFHLELTGPGTGVEVDFGKESRIRVTGDGEEKWRPGRGGELKASQKYPVVIKIKKGTVTAALGRTSMKVKRGKDAPPLDRLSFSSRKTAQGQRPNLTRFMLKGSLPESMPAVAVNRNRLSKRLAPIWEETFTVEGEIYEVSTPVSEEHAAKWSAAASRAAEAFTKKFPAPTEWKGEGHFYVFQDRAVFDSYHLSTRRRWRTAGTVTLFDAGTGDEASRASRAVVRDLTTTFTASAPPWWKEGLTEYYAGTAEEDGEITHGAIQPALAVQARRDLIKVTSQSFPTFLAGEKVLDDPRALGWAWVHYLMHGKDGTLDLHALTLHESYLRALPPKQAVAKAFPKGTLDGMYREFRDYVKELAAGTSED